MTITRTAHEKTVSVKQRILMLMATVALFAGLGAMNARAEEAKLSNETKACLACHDKAGMVKQFEGAEPLSLRISTKAYVDSKHVGTACEDCHSDVDTKTHGQVPSPFKSKRELSLSLRDVCRSCHEKKFTQYEASVHAALVKDGSKTAPVCSDCHNPHTVRKAKTIEPIASTPCAKCHADIFKAYSQDVHGQQRIAKSTTAPLCSDCHQAHAVKAASLGDEVKNACLTCHKDAVLLHSAWLPNAGRHFEAISCPACHAPDAQRRVNLRLYDQAKDRQVSEKVGVPQFVRLAAAADTKDMGLDERALWSLLKEFNRNGSEGKTSLRGRLEVRSGVQAHQMSDASMAIKDCKVCHQAGAAPFQSVSLTIAGPDGRPLRHGIQKEVLHSLTSMDSVRGFYAIGSTRIVLLDQLLVLVLLGAISVPLGHLAIKRLFKSVREKLESERLAASAPVDDGPTVAGRRTGDGATNNTGVDHE